MAEVVETTATDTEDTNRENTSTSSGVGVVCIHSIDLNGSATKRRSCQAGIQCITVGLAMTIESARVVGRPYY
jgi:hypothetical protein